MSFHFLNKMCLPEVLNSFLNLEYPNICMVELHALSTIAIFFELNCHVHFMDGSMEDFFLVFFVDILLL